MAVDAKIKMSIVTALDNAGIKATEDQINGLANSIKKANEESKLNKVEGAVGNLGGKLGKVTKALGGIPAQVGMIAGAFQLGWEIGTKFFDTVIRGWFGWEDAVTKLKKANRALQKEFARAGAAFDAITQKRIAAHDLEISKIDTAILKLNAQAMAYTRLSKAASEFANAGEDIEIQRLERERFEDILALQASGDYEAADQANKIYDIYRQQLDAKKRLANYDEESARFEEQRVQKEQEAFKFLEKVDKLEAQKAYWKNRIKEFEDRDDLAMTAKEYDKLVKPMEDKIAAIDRRIEAANVQAEKYANDLDVAQLESLTRERNRAILADQVNLEKDRLLWDYGQAVDRAGTDFGFGFTDNFIKEQYEASMKSYTELKDIKDNTENLAGKLDALLQLK